MPYLGFGQAVGRGLGDIGTRGLHQDGKGAVGGAFNTIQICQRLLSIKE